MRWLIWLPLLAACGEACPETIVRTCEDCAAGEPRHAVFIEGGESFEVDASPSGALVRESCNDELRVLGDDLTTARAIELAYDHHDENVVVALARGDDGTIAAVTFELDWVGDIDEDTLTKLRAFDGKGKLLWSHVLDDRESTAPRTAVAVGPQQVYVVEHGVIVSARTRATGELAWQQRFGSSAGQVIGDVEVSVDRVDPAGGLIVTGTFAGTLATGPGGPDLFASDLSGFVVKYAANGDVRWAVSSDALGISTLDLVAQGPDGSLAVQGGTGSVQRIAMLEPDGQLRWVRDLGDVYGDRVSSIATDGIDIAVAGDFTTQLSFHPETHNAGHTDGFIAVVGSAGVEWVQVVGGLGTQRADVVVLTAESLVAHATNFDNADAPAIELANAGVEMQGVGLALFDFVRPE
jgi:hypothetical protein